jgi:hypothetical protein
MTVDEIDSGKPEPENTRPEELLITALRMMRLRTPDDESEPARAVAHVQARVGERTVSAFGQVDIQPGHHDHHFGSEAWAAVETATA